MKYLATPRGANAETHVIDAPSDDALTSYARKRFGGVAWFCQTADEAVEDIQVTLAGQVRERPIGGDSATWGEWHAVAQERP